MSKSLKIFTGQIATNEKVNCFCCGGEIDLRRNAWLDPYVGELGKYVHEGCLSDKRKKECKSIKG
jgi:hypothetical protein